MVNWTLSIVLFPDLMAYCFTDNVFLPAQGPPLVPLSSFSVTKVFRWPNKFCFFRELLCCLMLYCEPVFVTVCDSSSCVDAKSGLFCLTLDLNPCNKRKRKRIEQSRSREKHSTTSPYPLSLLYSRFPRALQQNRAQSRFLYHTQHFNG